jgi:hypothetical protein
VTALVGLTEYGASGSFYKGNGLVLYNESLNDFFTVARFISVKDQVSNKPPEHLPDDIHLAFEEGATCLAVQCYNAGGNHVPAMHRSGNKATSA